MNAIKSLLAVSILAAAGAAHAAPQALSALITAQTAPLGTQTVTAGNNFVLTIDVDQNSASPSFSNLLSVSLTNPAAYTTHNSYLTGTDATWGAGSVWSWSVAGGVAISGITTEGDGSHIVTYVAGSTASVNSNAGGQSTFSGTLTKSGVGAAFITVAAAPWDAIELDVHLDSLFANQLGVVFKTFEKSSQAGSTNGIASNTYTVTGPAPAVPVPAAAWLFGSGLLGLAGTARRRRAA